MTGLSNRRTFLTALAIGARPLFSQSPEQRDATFSAAVSVVNILASVRDKQGRMVADLGKDDFLLTENGVTQAIRYFSRQTDLPLILGLLVDTSLSQRNVVENEKSASHRFVSKVIREDRDRAFLIHFDQDTELLQDFTGSRTVLDKALDKVEIAQGPRLVRRGPDNGGGGPRRGGSDRFPMPPGAGRRPAGTVLYDALFLAADDLLRHETGRKAVVLLTDGVDEGSKVSLTSAIEAAQRADLVVYSILFADEALSAPPASGGRRGGRGGRNGPPVGLPRMIDRADGKKVLLQISKQTGGGFFEVTKKLPLEEIYQHIEDELRNQYNIGYTPPKSDDTRYREISLTAKRKDLTVQAREGYYPTKR